MNSSAILYVIAALTVRLWYPVLRTVVREIALAARTEEEIAAEEGQGPVARRRRPGPLGAGLRRPRTRRTTWQEEDGAWSKPRRVNTEWDGGRPLRALPPANDAPKGPRRIEPLRRRSA